MKKNKLFLLAFLVFLVPFYRGLTQSSYSVAAQAVINGLEVDTTEVEMYGTNLSLHEEDTDKAPKVLVDHSILYEAIRATKGKEFFLYKRIDKIVYLMPIPVLRGVIKLEESMADN